MVYHVLPGGRYMEMDPPRHRAVKLLGVVGGWILRGGEIKVLVRVFVYPLEESA